MVAPETVEGPCLREGGEGDLPVRRLFILSAILSLLLTLALSVGSGTNEDEKFQVDYASRLVRYYLTWGIDRSALQVPTGNMHYYGGFFDTTTGFANFLLGFEPGQTNYLIVRHVVTALLGFSTMLVTGLLAREVAGWKTGLLAMMLIVLSPRFLGHSLMNSKDIPFAAGYALALYGLVRLLREPPLIKWWAAVGLAFGIGIAFGTRVGGLVLAAYPVLLGAVVIVGRKRSGRGVSPGGWLQFGGAVAGASIAGLAIGLAFWPFGMQSPLQHSWEAWQGLIRSDVAIRLLYQGENVLSSLTSWDYLPQWITRTVPLSVLAGLLVSIPAIPKIIRRSRKLPLLAVLLFGLGPLMYALIDGPALHDGWRHLTFVYPCLVVIAALGWITVNNSVTTRGARRAVLLAFGFLLIEPALFIARNHQVPYVYFNPLGGGLRGAFGRFETDYWGVSVRQGLEWMESHGLLPAGSERPVTIATNFHYAVSSYVDAKYPGRVKVLYRRFPERYGESWDYGIFGSRFIKGSHLRSRNWPNSRSIHSVEADGVPLLSIERGDGPVFAGEQAFAVGDWHNAVRHFVREVQLHPDNEVAWGRLTLAYAQVGSATAAMEAANRWLMVAPDDPQGLQVRGLLAMNSGRRDQAEQDFLRLVRVERDSGIGYYYLAEIQHQSGRNQDAAASLRKALEIMPGFPPAQLLWDRISGAEDLPGEFHDRN